MSRASTTQSTDRHTSPAGIRTGLFLGLDPPRQLETRPMDPPSPGIVVRAMEPADIPALTEVLNQPRAVWGTLQTPFVSVDARQQRHTETSRNDVGLVAMMEGRVIGSIGLHRDLPHRRS